MGFGVRAVQVYLHRAAVYLLPCTHVPVYLQLQACVNVLVLMLSCWLVSGLVCQVGHNYRVSFLKSYRYSVAVRLRELPLHEYFHRLFILKQVPRSLGHDMRLALHQQQLPQEAARDWLPYLDAPTRSQHKRVGSSRHSGIYMLILHSSSDNVAT